MQRFCSIAASALRFLRGMRYPVSSLLPLRVAAAFLADAERSAAGRWADASPLFLPPASDDSCVSGLPRPEPDLLPPPLSLFTVAQARRSASFFGVPRSS